MKRAESLKKGMESINTKRNRRIHVLEGQKTKLERQLKEEREGFKDYKNQIFEYGKNREKRIKDLATETKALNLEKKKLETKMGKKEEENKKLKKRIKQISEISRWLKTNAEQEQKLKLDYEVKNEQLTEKLEEQVKNTQEVFKKKEDKIKGLEEENEHLSGLNGGLGSELYETGEKLNKSEIKRKKLIARLDRKVSSPKKRMVKIVREVPPAYDNEAELQKYVNDVNLGNLEVIGELQNLVNELAIEKANLEQYRALTENFFIIIKK
jgi:chromosome segregation ATPase